MENIIAENQQQFGSLLTVLGENAEQNGKLLNKQINFTHIAIGDANDTYVQPDRKQESLVNELARIKVNSVDVLQPTSDSVPMLKIEAILPDELNDLVIREFAAVAEFNGQEYLHAVGNCARVYVPAPINNGNVSTPITIEMIFVITSAEPIVLIDPNVVTASREWVNKNFKPVTPSDFIFEGDSITEGNTIGDYKYSDVFAGLSFARERGGVNNFAVGGSFIIDGSPSLEERYASKVFPLRPRSKGGSGKDVVYLFVLAGTNDLDHRYGSGDATSVTEQLTDYTQRAMNDGFTVVLQTILPRRSNWAGWNVNAEKQRLTINAAIRRGSIPSDIVADTESWVNDVNSSLMFHDGIHPTKAGADMIAMYLNNVMEAGGALPAGNIMQGRFIQGLFESKDKTVLKVGSEYCSTSLGTDLNENFNGFLTIKNLNPTKANSSTWFVEAGVDGDKVKFQAVSDAGSGKNGTALTLNRDGIIAWAEAGSVGQKTVIGTPQSENDSAPIYMVNLSASLGADESVWGWVTNVDGNARPSSLELKTLSDDFSTQHTAVEFKRKGARVSSVAFSSSISTSGTAIRPALWELGSIEESQGPSVLNPTKYVEIEINGELVKLGVINDPNPA
ncbi:phage tail protein [Vibrio sp. 10N.222.55.E8]|uniref:phage tail-collar fiber domain-containing protein n=1 Tax=Vibrio artabrorum TaxID=446374 RepID=UPI0035543656